MPQKHRIESSDAICQLIDRAQHHPLLVPVCIAIAPVYAQDIAATKSKFEAFF